MSGLMRRLPSRHDLLRLGGLLLAIGLSLLLLGPLLSALRDPFGAQARRMTVLQRQAEVGRQEASARREEVRANAAVLRALEQLQISNQRLRAMTDVVVQEAGRADDANTPLDPERVDRLRRHDAGLCHVAPDLTGCAATSSGSRTDTSAVRAPDAGGGGDA